MPRASHPAAHDDEDNPGLGGGSVDRYFASKPTLTDVSDAALFARLEELGAEPWHTPEGHIRCTCVAHGGDNQSALALGPSEDRSWWARCYSHGCTYKEIVTAIVGSEPLERTDGELTEGTVATNPNRTNGKRPRLLPVSEWKTEADEHRALMKVGWLVNFLVTKRKISLRVLEEQVIGWRPSVKRVSIPYHLPSALAGYRQSGRTFARDLWCPPRFRTERTPKVMPDADDDDWSLPRWAYYPPDGMLNDKWAVITEGCMDALAVISAGLPAVGLPSSNMWREGFVEELIELDIRTLYVPHDNDVAGEEFVQRIEAGVDGSIVDVIPVDLGLDDKQDVTDFLCRYRGFSQGGRALRRLMKEAE